MLNYINVKITEITDNKDRELMCPAIYKHFKGNYYATMGVSTCQYWEIAEEYEVDDIKLEYIKARHTETDKIINIWKFGNNYFHDKEIYEDKHLVLYKSLYDDSEIYARELNMFLSKVDQEKYPNIEQEYRFELMSQLIR